MYEAAKYVSKLFKTLWITTGYSVKGIYNIFINPVANVMEQPLIFMIFFNSYCLHKSKKENKRKARELNPARSYAYPITTKSIW